MADKGLNNLCDTGLCMLLTREAKLIPRLSFLPITTKPLWIRAIEMPARGDMVGVSSGASRLLQIGKYEIIVLYDILF